MLSITTIEIGQRWDTLPDVLREAIASDAMNDLITTTCAENHIPDAKVGLIARLVGFVLLGFLHPEDLAKEMCDVTGIDIRITTAIAGVVNARVFTPIRAEIDKVYRPISESSQPSIPNMIDPKIMEEVRPIMPIGSARQKFSGGGIVPPVPVSSVNNYYPAPAPVPPSFSRSGWSGIPVSQVSSGKTVDLRVSMSAVPPSPPPPPSSSIFPNLQKTDMGKIPVPPMNSSAMHGASTIQNGPMPIIIQNDISAAPLPNCAIFNGKSEDKIAALSQNPPRPDAPPAVLEFSGDKPPLPPHQNSSMTRPPAPPSPIR